MLKQTFLLYSADNLLYNCQQEDVKITKVAAFMNASLKENQKSIKLLLSIRNWFGMEQVYCLLLKHGLLIANAKGMTSLN